MIKIDIESTFEPIIGSKQQAESFIDYLNHNGNDKEAIFSCDVFVKLRSIETDSTNSFLFIFTPRNNKNTRLV